MHSEARDRERADRTGGVADDGRSADPSLIEPRQQRSHLRLSDLDRARNFGPEDALRLTIGDETREVKTGDVCYQPPFQQHVLTNTSETEDLIFLTVYWEDLKLWQGRQEAAYEVLAPIYGWFTEGFDTADLQEARALLEVLA